MAERPIGAITAGWPPQAASRCCPREDADGSTADSAGYDALPYPAMPITYTQPSHLAALAMLFGLSPANAEHARVLELGCASGGNIIPLASRFPNAHFVGID